MFRYWKLREFFKSVKLQFKKRAVLLLQKVCRGYLAYNLYFAKLKGTMTNKNMDYILTKHADAKIYMRECLQISLAYLVRKMIKRKKIAAEIKRLADIAEKKRIAKEKEEERLRKLHEDRKQKKRQVKLMIKESAQIFL